MNSKERAQFRSAANTLEPIFQVGKDGVSENTVEAVDKALKKRELIKLSVLDTCEYDAKEVAAVLAEATASEIIQCIGRKLVLYRKRPDDED